MKKCLLFITALLFGAIHSFSQTPNGPLINCASQDFLKNGFFQSKRSLFVSQFLSPRLVRPGKGNYSESVFVMYIGHWLDITNEVIVTAPNSNQGRGVTVKRIIEKKNGKCTSGYAGSNRHIYNYNGAYVVVEFEITDDAAIGTHTVILKRPRFGGGKDQSIPFYLEVMNEERVYDIKFKKDGENTFKSFGRKNESGTVLIRGQNLGDIQLEDHVNLLNGNGFFRDISDPVVMDNQISFKATLVKVGKLGYNDLIPFNMRSPEYPRGELRVIRGSGNSGMFEGDLEIRSSPPGTPSCNFLRSQLGLVSVKGQSPKRANLTVSFFGDTLMSNVYNLNLTGSDITKYNLCPAGAAKNQSRTVEIGKLFVRVTNTGDTAARPATLQICTVTNSNFDVPPSINVPALGAGAQVEYELTRKENKISVITNTAGACVRSPDNTNGIKRWNDVGIIASIYTSVINGASASNAAIR